ncbi:MAG: nucleotidyltransferase domain-containing protein [Acidimicrobiaceae bacterium]|nr:nucleotidyltransferase domain-containing protein [Acidimicrobiaceae bacterium]
MAVVEEVPTISDARRLALRLAEEPLVETVLVFGSVARGDAGPGSDLDMVVLLSDAAARDYVATGRRLRRMAAEAQTEGSPHCRGGDMVVRLKGDWEHAVANVPSSFEAAVAFEAVELLPPPTGSSNDRSSGRPPTIMPSVPTGDLDVAASHLRGAANGLETLLALAAMAGSVPAADPQGRCLSVLSGSHLVIELSAKSVVAAEGGRSSRTHDIGERVEAVADADTRRRFQAALSDLRDADGELTDWRGGIYHLDDENWLAKMTAENAAGHARAAAAAASVAADFLDERSDRPAHRAVTAIAREHGEHLVALGITPRLFTA